MVSSIEPGCHGAGSHMGYDNLVVLVTRHTVDVESHGPSLLNRVDVWFCSSGACDQMSQKNPSYFCLTARIQNYNAGLAALPLAWSGVRHQRTILARSTSPSLTPPGECSKSKRFRVTKAPSLMSKVLRFIPQSPLKIPDFESLGFYHL